MTNSTRTVPSSSHRGRPRLRPVRDSRARASRFAHTGPSRGRSRSPRGRERVAAKQLAEGLLRRRIGDAPADQAPEATGVGQGSPDAARRARPHPPDWHAGGGFVPRDLVANRRGVAKPLQCPTLLRSGKATLAVIQHKKEAYWFYRSVSPLYDRGSTRCSGRGASGTKRSGSPVSTKRACPHSTSAPAPASPPRASSNTLRRSIGHARSEPGSTRPGQKETQAGRLREAPGRRRAPALRRHRSTATCRAAASVLARPGRRWPRRTGGWAPVAPP